MEIEATVIDSDRFAACGGRMYKEKLEFVHASIASSIIRHDQNI